MKEATGELNMTVVTVVAIAALMAFFYLIIWPTIKTGMTLTSACSASNGEKYDMTTDDGEIHCEGGSCTFTDSDSGATNTKECSQASGNRGGNGGNSGNGG